MKRLLLGAVIISAFALGDCYINNNCISRMDTSKVDFKGEIIHKDIKELKVKTIEDIKKEVLEEIKKESKEKARLEELEKINLLKSKEESSKKHIEFTLTFYTSLPEENGGHTVTCKGEKLKYGMVASNVYPLGTKINLKGYGIFTISDRGGSNFNSPNRLDVLIERNGGEGDTEYLNRVNNMGKPTVTGYIENKKFK